MEKGNIREIWQTETTTLDYYLPHFAIIKPGRAKTKTHIVLVFDASAKCNGISLNDVIYTPGAKTTKGFI